jgi:RNA polymerase sigma-70 factor (ECF subfamily)
VIPDTHIRDCAHVTSRPPLRVEPGTSPEDLCDRFLPEVLRWCARLGGQHVVPEDAAHDVMIVVLRKAHTVDPERLRSWVFGVTRRTLAWHRRKSFWRRFVGESVQVATPGRSPESLAGASESTRAVHAVLDRLGADLREVLVLCDLEDRTDRDVAEILDIPVGTAKSRLRRARAEFARLAAIGGLEEGGA